MVMSQRVEADEVVMDLQVQLKRSKGALGGAQRVGEGAWWRQRYAGWPSRIPWSACTPSPGSHGRPELATDVFHPPSAPRVYKICSHFLPHFIPRFPEAGRGIC